MVELEAASGLGGMVRKIAESCGISDKSNTAMLIERIKRALTPNTLLILDEVHLLKHTYRLNSFFACVEVLRRIYDHCQCGMVLSWTNLENLRSASQGELIQLWRRGVHKIALPAMPTKADLESILAHAGLDFPERQFTVKIPTRKEDVIESPYEVLRSLAKNEGLKAITERIRYARKLANKTNQKINWHSFIDAHHRIEKQATQEPEWN
jgi:DNA transposition AAA+ family ATPase